ncbi:MAG: copper amine oxidase N-terminal domain-containing protein [Peptococcaceae bacterium]|nr:copper amine oxidase N-terminal domain-containing protein [Peptococcaceae bacterium]
MSVLKTTGQSVSLKFNTPGVYTINVAGYTDAIDTAVAGKISDFTGTAEVLKYLKTFPVAMTNDTVTVSAAGGADYSIALKEDANGDGVADAALASVSVDADNGYTSKIVYAQLSRTVAGGDTVTVAGVDLKVVADSHAVTITKLDAATKANGIQRFQVTATIPGDFNVYVSYDNAPKQTLPVYVDPAGATSVATLAQPTAPIDKTSLTSDATGILFEITDETGYAYEGSAAGVELGIDHKVTVLEAPTAFPKSTQFELVWGSHNDEEGWVLVGKDADSAANNTGVSLTKEGKYTFKVALKNGSAATASVTVGEFDEAVAIMFAKVPNTVVFGANDFTIADAQVIAIDANGVTKEATLAGAGTLSVSANGAAVSNFTDEADINPLTPVVPGYKLVVKNVDEDKYVGITITLFAVLGTGSDALTAKHEITVTEAADTIVYEDVEIAAGKSVTLYGDVVDASGKVVKMPGAAVQVIVLDKPENAIASVNPTTTIGNDGKVEVKFLASASGEYKIQTIVTQGGKYISGIETITVGAQDGRFKDVVVISMGANSMIVNDELVKLDVAPFIENGRTMLQYNVLYVFGIDVQWVKEIESVVAEGNGIKVVMTIGSKVATVNGEEVTLDVAPYVVNGRTVVPVGLITGVFDINFDFTRNADGTIADILFTK